MYLHEQSTGIALTTRQHQALEAWLATQINPSFDLSDPITRSYIVNDYQGEYKENHWLDSTAPLFDVTPIKFRDALREGYTIVEKEPKAQAVNESFTDSWGSQIFLFKAVTDNTLSLTITDGGELTGGKLSNADIDRLIALLQKAKN